MSWRTTSESFGDLASELDLCLFHNGAIPLCASPVCVPGTGFRSREARGEFLVIAGTLKKQYERDVLPIFDRI